MKSRKFGSCLIVSILISAFILAGVTSFFFYLNSLPPISQLQNYQPSFVSQIIDANGKEIKTFGAYRYEKTDIKQVPEIFKKAIISTEDKNFYTHKGFDPVALLRSSLSNIRAGHTVQGASTITQQLARVLFLSSEKTMDRKVKELIIAYRLEKTLPKDEILGMYLNNIYLGEGAYGIAAASKVYFNKKVEELTLPEAALIAGLPQAPSVYSPYQNMDAALERRSEVLGRMVKMGFITPAEADKANKTQIRLNPSNRPYSLNKAPYFVDYVMSELRQKTGISEQELIQGGYRVYTTLDYSAQDIAQTRLERDLRARGLTKNSQEAALVSLDVATGKILAYVGGKDYGVSQYDRASQATRQPGSSFKPFVYAAAMEKGLTPNTMYDDTPLTIGDWSPHNYGNKYRGKIPLYKALAYSSNVVASRLIQDVGVQDTINMAKRLGISTQISPDLTIALGSSAVKLIDITSAYGVFASGGIKVEPYAIEKIETSNGRVIYQASGSGSRVLDARTATAMVNMMQQVIKIGTGRAANIGVPAAGKTGTTDNYVDAWFVGFTPEIVTGVWVGNDDNTPNKGITGGTLPAKIWRDFMIQVAKHKEPVTFSAPEITIDSNSTAPIPNAAPAGTTSEPTPDENNTDENAYTGEEPAPFVPPAPSSPTMQQAPKRPVQKTPVDTGAPVPPIPQSDPGTSSTEQ